MAVPPVTTLNNAQLIRIEKSLSRIDLALRELNMIMKHAAEALIQNKEEPNGSTGQVGYIKRS